MKLLQPCGESAERQTLKKNEAVPGLIVQSLSYEEESDQQYLVER